MKLHCTLRSNLFVRYLFACFYCLLLYLLVLCSLTVHLMSKSDMSVDLKLVPDNSSCLNQGMACLVERTFAECLFSLFILFFR